MARGAVPGTLRDVDVPDLCVRGAERPQGPAPVVVRRRSVAPCAVGAAPVVHQPVIALCGDHEVEVPRTQGDHLRRRLRLPRRDDKGPRDVVDAEAVLLARGRPERMLEQPERLGQPREVVERQVRPHQATMLDGAATSDLPRVM